MKQNFENQLTDVNDGTATNGGGVGILLRLTIGRLCSAPMQNLQMLHLCNWTELIADWTDSTRRLPRIPI